MKTFISKYILHILYAIVIIVIIRMAIPHKEIGKNNNSDIFVEEQVFNDNSYWYIYFINKNNNERYSGFITQPHNYFSVAEFKVEKGNDKFLISFTEVSEETYNYNQ